MLWRGNLGSMNVVARQLWSTKKGCRRPGQSRTQSMFTFTRHLFVAFNVLQRPQLCLHSALATRQQPHLAGVVVFHLPASWKLQLFVGKHVEEGHQVPVVLVALEVVSISTNLADHMFQTSVGGEHTVGTLRAGMVGGRERTEERKVRKTPTRERNALFKQSFLTAIYNYHPPHHTRFVAIKWVKKTQMYTFHHLLCSDF